MFNANWTISAGVTQSIPDFDILRNVAGSGGSMLEHIYRVKLMGGPFISTRSMPSIAADGVEAYTHHQPRLV